MRSKLNQIFLQVYRIIAAIPLRPLRKVIQFLSLLTSVYVISKFIPKTWLNDLPATGGDMGSHFWPVKVLHDFGIPNWTLRPWNPGNNGGEGLLVHYFPLPFVFMAVLGYLIPTGMAFNFGTLLPVILLPLSVWEGLKLMGLRFPATAMAAIFSAAMVLNEGYSMWGGNTLSTLAGQFAHMYALNFMILGTGLLWKELTHKKIPWGSGILFSAVALSHGYIYFGIPFLILLTIIFHPKGSIASRALTGALSGLISFLLSAWFLGPMILNGSWITPHSFSWQFSDWIQEVLPRIFDPLIFAFFISLLFLSYRLITRRDHLLIRTFLFWFFSGLVYVILFFIFRALHLVDVRALPQTQLFWSVASAIGLATVLRPLTSRAQYLLTAFILAFVVPWEWYHVVKFPIWLDWNYSGWQSKPNYPQLIQLSDGIRGNLSQPRLAYEHHVKNNFVGTERVFEMLPYFANRATTESLYLQSTILAPMLFSFTSEISEGASCPFSNWPCQGPRLLQAQNHMELLGVQELILSTPFTKQQAQNAPFLKAKLSSGPWTVYTFTQPVSMVETFSSQPETIPFENFREKFWDWYRSYEKGKVFLVTTEKDRSLPEASFWKNPKECHPSTTADFSGVTLKTDCPGTAHFLKYAYHPSFTSSGGESLFLVSPGFLGVVPKSSEIKLSFGSSWKWSVFRWVSVLFSISLVLCLLPQIRNQALGFWKKMDGLKSKPSKTHISKKSKRSQSKNPERKKPKLQKALFLVLSISISIGYIFLSFKTDTIFFWNWRKLNFRDFKIVESRQDWGTLHKNQSLEGGPLVVKGEIHYSGISTHANSEIKIHLINEKPFFTGKCAYPDSAFGANIQCEIRSNSRVLYTSPPLNNDNREQLFKILRSQEEELTLIFRTLKSDINGAHAAWLDLTTSD